MTLYLGGNFGQTASKSEIFTLFETSFSSLMTAMFTMEKVSSVYDSFEL